MRDAPVRHPCPAATARPVAAAARRHLFSLVLLVAAAVPLTGADPRPPRAWDGVAAPLLGTGPHAASAQHESFAALVARLSEPGGYFDTDNLISNEASYLQALDRLRALGVHGGAYIGVGPDQNFSYIARIRPRAAFIIDIRRDNLLEQLWLKALFELSRDRADYLSLMFGRPRPAFRVPAGEAGLVRLLDYVDATPPDPRRVAAARAAVHAALRRFGVPLSAEDTATIDRFHDTFIAAGPALRFSTLGQAPRSYDPTYRQLLLERDRAGHRASYLVGEEDFRFVKQLEGRGRIIPVVGDLAGPHALRAIGDEARAEHVAVSAFYTSNVEFYLMREGSFDRFAANVATLPLAPASVIIRSWFHPFRAGPADAVPGHASTQLVQPIRRFLERMRAGGYRSYRELVLGDGG